MAAPTVIRAALVFDAHLLPFLFGEAELERLSSLVEVVTPQPVTSVGDIPERDRQSVELVVAGWGAPGLEPQDLEALPALRGSIHWAGGGGFIDPEVAETRGIAMAAGKSFNAAPVAEWTVAMIVLAAKEAFWISRDYCAHPRFVDRERELPQAGLFNTKVGLVGASAIGSLVAEMLGHYDVDVFLFDPFIDDGHAAELGAERVPDLAELARCSDILSIHAPLGEATKSLVSKEVLAAMPDGATLINTARGAIVDQEALVEELESGRIRAILDVTEPEVLPEGHPLLSLPNVFLTPHMAGSVSRELQRLGLAALVEVENFVSGRPFDNPV